MAQTIESILTQAAARNIFQQGQSKALTWFMQQAKIASVTDASLIREFDRTQHRNVTQIMSGGMYFFYYDPKLKETLPYYDTFPCIWLLNIYPDRFLGLNMHYLPYGPRVKLMDALLDLENNAKLPKNKKLEISYSILTGAVRHKLFKPCIKMYLNNHVRSKLIKVAHEEWPVAAFLPVHSFQKAKASKVWNDATS